MTAAKKNILVFMFISSFLIYASGEEISDLSRSGINAVERFRQGTLADKLEIVKQTVPENGSFDLYRLASEYVFLNSGYYKNNPFFDELSVSSVSGLIRILNNNSGLRKKASYKDIEALLEYISTIESGPILPYLFRMKNTDYPAEIKNRAERIFKDYEGPLYPVVIDILENNPVSDRLDIYRQAMGSKRLSLLEKGEISTTALDSALNYKVVDHKETEIVKTIIITAVDKVAELTWSEASPLVLKYFDQLIAYENTDVIREPLIETIRALGILGTHEAAVRLNMYIGLINSFAEKGLDYDEEILLEVIINLGRIGDLVAYENLSSVGNYGYKEEIALAASEAAEKLSISR